MSDPLRTDPPRLLEEGPAGDRDAKIEELLLSGLDHYFAARYEQAINVWTRALFLDRSHARARAYIDRARSALAERQRRSDELLHNGAAAFQRGDASRARELLLAAIEGGANPDEASALLDRLARLESVAAAPTDRAAARTQPHPAAAGSGPRRSAAMWTVSAAMLALIAAGVYVALDWRQLQSFVLGAADAAPRAVASPAPPESVPPPPRRGELALARARALAASGHLHDALAALDGVRPTDSQRPEADRLRASIQRQLLALAALPPAERGTRR